MTDREICLHINSQMPPGGLFTGAKTPVHPDSNVPWRISPEPYWISPEKFAELEELGTHLLSFLRACNTLYSQCVRGIAPKWVMDYIDRGKPEQIIDMSRIRRTKSNIPQVIRPDIVDTENGLIITELDSVPGGIGFTGKISQIYSDLGYPVVGGRDGMPTGFAETIRSVARKPDPTLAIVVSEESNDYRDEMMWLGSELREIGLNAHTIKPEELLFDDEGVYVGSAGSRERVDVIYRFFELFDLRNVPKSDLIMYMVRMGKVKVTPPFKHFLEEKLLMGLLDHPELGDFWARYLGRKAVDALNRYFPRTWIVDPTPLPPHAVIPGLYAKGRPVTKWSQLTEASQRERRLVLKASGFSELAWGARSVVVGHDVPTQEWAQAIQNALESFDRTRYILQEFHKAETCQVKYYDFERDEIITMSGRARLCPYYMVWGDKAHLSGLLATVCPDDKKVLHGMTDAVTIPCAFK